MVSAVLLVSCGNTKYRNDASCDELASVVLSESDKEFAEYDDSYADYIISDTSICVDLKIIYSLEVNDIDEIGIFKTAYSDTANQLQKELIGYIEDIRLTQRAFIESYAPTELTKLESAKVRAFGNYVIYVIASADSANKTISAIENALA